MCKKEAGLGRNIQSILLIQEKARRYRAERHLKKEDTCSMCGNFCAVKNMNRILDGEIVNTLMNKKKGVTHVYELRLLRRI